MIELAVRFAVVRISPKRYQAARSHMRAGRGAIMLDDWDTFGPKFKDWRQAHDHAVSVMTPAQRTQHLRDDIDEDDTARRGIIRCGRKPGHADHCQSAAVVRAVDHARRERGEE